MVVTETGITQSSWPVPEASASELVGYRSRVFELSSPLWSLHPDAQGRGLAIEGAREMLRLGFDELGLHRIMAACDPRNVAYLRVMEHLGMRREAEFVDHEFLKGEWIGEIVCAVLEAEWRLER